jgi:hypothetical protein
MPPPISSITPVSAAAPVADAATPGVTLQAGTVVGARVVSVMADNLVRIAIANLSMDVMSEVALTPGQNLQLAVSQNEAGVRLAIVNGAGEAATDQVMLTPRAASIVDSAPLAPAVDSRNVLTPLEQIAVSMASEAAVTRQGSQAPLFANLSSVMSGGDLPPALKQAVLGVLAQQTSLDPQLGGRDIEAAFRKSGLFLEASLAAGTLPSSGATPDLKAALLVLRQALASTTGAFAGQPQTAASASVPHAVAVLEQSAIEMLQAPSLSPEIGSGTSALRGPSAAAAALAEAAAGLPLAELPRDVGSGAALRLLQETMQEMPHATGATAAANKLALQDAHGAGATAPAPPPFRGALPALQPIASPSLAPDTPLAATVHRLLDDTDAAIARQTLLQVASLPDRIDASGQRIDPSVPQWTFEIPFATPQGTAMAQFEISRDGGAEEPDPAKRAWRARFSLNVEPAGPVHALVTLIGDRTSVRMWAERPATVAQLRAGIGELSQALAKAELKAGDIVVREGTPPQPAPARAGHFLDRAL